MSSLTKNFTNYSYCSHLSSPASFKPNWIKTLLIEKPTFAEEGIFNPLQG